MDKNYGQLLIWGVYCKDEGYPNVLYRIAELANYFEIKEINYPIWIQAQDQQRKFTRGLKSHFIVCWRYLWTRHTGQLVYLPYPAVFLLFFLSFLPKFLRPQWIVADVFISLYDTIVNDRKLLTTNCRTAKFLHWIEGRAYRQANVIIVDTLANREFLRGAFNLSGKQIVAIPLSTNERQFSPRKYFPQAQICRVLFIGTFIPLHGVEYLAEAIIALQGNQEIQFKIIGNGQEAQLFKNILGNNPVRQLEWIREWQTAEYLAEEISRADICLGIFGPGAKTQRVCPLKIYAYAAIGRAIITGDTDWLRTAGGAEFFSTVPVANSAALAKQISLLASQPHTRAQLAVRSRNFYETKLSNTIACAALLNCFPQSR